MSEPKETLSKDLSDIAAKIGAAANAINININFQYQNRVESIMIQQHMYDFEKHFSDMKVRTVERNSPEYPYQKEIDIGGVTFFALYSAEPDEI